MLQKNREYSTRELIKELGISENQWNYRREEILDSLKFAYNYEIIIKGRSTYFVIKEQIGEFEKPLRKNAKEKVEKVLQELAVDIIQKDNLQTAANLSRLVEELPEIKKLNMKQPTLAKHFSSVLKESFGKEVNEGGTKGKISERVWCELDRTVNKYYPMSQEEIDYFFDLLHQQNQIYDSLVGLDFEETKHLQTEELAAIGQKVVSSYRAAQEAFKLKYGYYPIKVPSFLVTYEDCKN